MLDGVGKDKYAGFNYWGVPEAERKAYAKYNSRGVGSAKELEIKRLLDRYQGAKDSMLRILHMFDVYNRPTPEGEYERAVFEKGKEVLMGATSADHMLKFNTVNNPDFYKDIMGSTWDTNLQESTRKAMEKHNNLAKGKVLDRFIGYIQRFKDLIANSDVDFTKPNHIMNWSASDNYTANAKTRLSNFNLISQNPVEFFKESSARRYGNQKWLRIASTIGGTVLGVTLLAQLGFGKLKNPQNLKKQVNENANN